MTISKINAKVGKLSAKRDDFGNMVFPGAKWIGSPNFGYPAGTHGRNTLKPKAIVVHVAEGTLAGCDGWFNDPAPGGNADAAVSAHFAIGPTGEVHQYVSTEDAAWGNGVLEQGFVLPPGGEIRVNPNLYTISIEHAGFYDRKFPLETLLASVRLIKYLCIVYQIPYSGAYIIRHSQLAPITRPYCPGPHYPLDLIIELLNAAGAPLTTPLVG